MSQLNTIPYVAPAMQPDVPGHGVPSDDMAVAVPLAGAGEGAVTREFTIKSSRPLPDSKVRECSEGQFVVFVRSTNEQIFSNKKMQSLKY